LSTKSKKGTKRFDDILSELSETFTAFIVTVTQELAKVIKVVSRRVF
jgi:BMFP domain-containing protein YqiC